MTFPTIALSRRLLLGLLAATPLAGRTWADAGLEERLATALAELKMPWAAEFRLLELTEQQDTLSARVEMQWPPGVRQRGFKVSNGDTDRALARLIEDIETEFGSAA